MSILRLVWRACRHVVERGASHYADTGSLARTLLYVLKYTHSLHRRRREQWKAVAAHRATARDVTAALSGKIGTPQLAIRISGGIGDYIVIARFLRDLAAAVEPFDFDLYCANESGADWVFRSIPGFRKCYSEILFENLAPSYALAMWISQFAIVREQQAQWRTLREQRRLMRVVANIMRFRKKIDIMVEHHPYMDGFLGQKAVFMNLDRTNFLHGMANIAYEGPELGLCCDLSLFERLGLEGQEYITINNGFDPGFVITGSRATKCYPHCDELVRRFKARFPRVLVVQIGTATSVPIPSADINLVDRTTLQQAAGLLSGARLHIDNEGGLVHVARCLGVKSCVIFGPTSVEYFAYPDNINIRPTFCGGCWWVNPTWMDTCPRRFETARCMSTQRPEDIIAAIEAAAVFPGVINGARRPARADVPIAVGSGLHPWSPTA